MNDLRQSLGWAVKAVRSSLGAGGLSDTKEVKVWAVSLEESPQALKGEAREATHSQGTP